MEPDAAPIIDAHHHLWRPDAASYPWMAGPAMRPIRKPFTIADLEQVARANGVGHTVLVQARPDLRESLDLLAVAARHDIVAGVVGWVDLTAPDVADQIGRLRRAPGGDRLVGIRPMAQFEPDERWLLRPDVGRGLAAVTRAGLTFDLLVTARELPSAVEVVRAHPVTTFVLDHIAKPPIASGDLRWWAADLAPLGELENVSCKVSGLVTEAAWESWSVDDLRPAIQTALEVFGEDRLIFGSDWPVCLLAASYERVLAAARACLSGLSAAARDGVFGANARREYRLRI
jgi:L-fuconolactonase